jgi:AraC-like DNA-binding protein/ligand-binding sensor protein
MPLKAASVAEKLSRSKIFKDYERAFGELTGLPLSLRTEEVLKLVQHGKKHENPFCALLAKDSHSCAACLRVQDAIGKQKGIQAHTVFCFAGLCDTAVPVRVGDLKIGLLQTGQVFLKKPSRRGFRKAARQLIELGSSVNLQKLEDAYFHSQVLSPKQYQSAVRLLKIFGQHLSVAANDLILRERAGEPTSVHKAREYIEQHQGEKISLSAVARAVNISSYYFCRTFKKATGLNFTEYLSRVRVGKAKNLLINPNLRVTEIAYAIGFQSLPHFNKMFKTFTGMSPTAFRKRHCR